ILVDFSTGFNQDRVKLISKPFDLPSGGMMGMQNMMGSDFEQGTGFSIMEFRITKSDVNTSFELPEQLSTVDFPSESDATTTRPVQLDMQMGQGHTINGRLFEMERVDIEVNQGDTEIWEFINNTNFPHPMHVHAVHFKVLERSGNRGLLPTETGWKDTVLVLPGERVKVIMKFDAPKGMYVFHCHNLEHEDAGMMANFQIIN
ncbi:MAG: multicopper oxidase domain-containing protein, partial [Balneolaceae bacterium]